MKKIKEMLIIALVLIVLTICMMITGTIDSESRLYLESTPKTDLQSRLIRH